MQNFNENFYRTPPHLPEVRIKDEPFLQVASAARTMINRAIATLGDIASGRDVKKFLAVSTFMNLWCTNNRHLTMFLVSHNVR